jgi:hypothetical protein
MFPRRARHQRLRRRKSRSVPHRKRLSTSATAALRRMVCLAPAPAKRSKPSSVPKGCLSRESLDQPLLRLYEATLPLLFNNSAHHQPLPCRVLLANIRCRLIENSTKNKIFTNAVPKSSGGVATGTARASAENPARFIQLRRSWICVVTICPGDACKRGHPCLTTRCSPVS